MRYRMRMSTGRLIETEINNQVLWDKMVEHYADDTNFWNCPNCGSEIDALDDSFDETMHEDTYVCTDRDCGLMITFTTPKKYCEYHQVPDRDWRITVEAGAMGYQWRSGNEEDES